MHRPSNAKVIQLLKSFDTNDWRECDDFIKGRVRPGHDCQKLYQYIKKYRNNWNSKNLSHELIKGRIFNDITDKSFTNILSKLSLIIEDYLVFCELKKDTTEFRLTLLKGLASRGLFHQFNLVADKMEDEIIVSDKLELFEELHLLRLNHLRFFSNNPIKNEYGDILITGLQKRNRFFFQHYNDLISAVEIHNKELSHKYKKERFEKNKIQSVASVVTPILDFKRESTNFKFKQLYELLLKKKDVLSVELQSIIIDFLVHDGYKQIKSGSYRMVEELLNIYEFGFDTGILLTNNKIAENRFVNVVNVASACRKFSRAHQFINKYQSMLNESIKPGTLRISKAHIDFYNGNYDILIDKIRDYSFNSLSQDTRRRWLLLCSYYKEFTDNTDFIENQIKNYNSYFYNNRNKFSKAVYDGSINLSKVIAMMTKNISNNEIMSFIDSSDELIFKTWVINETGAA